MTHQRLTAILHDVLFGDGWDSTTDVILIVIAAIVILALYLNAPGVIYGW